MGSRPAGAMTGRGTRPGKGSTWERGRPARILLLMVVAELPRGFAGSHPLATETANDQAEGDPPGSAGVPPASCCLWWPLSFRAALQAVTLWRRKPQ